MGKFSSYTIEFTGTVEDIDVAKEAVLGILGDYCLETAEDKIEVQEEYELVWVEVIANELAVPLAEEAPNLEFVISGVVDTSESAGEYMDFLIEYRNRKMTVRTSDWYRRVCADFYNSYEAFCADFHDKEGTALCTEVQYQKFRKDRLWYALERDEEECLVQKVPLGTPMNIRIKP